MVFIHVLFTIKLVSQKLLRYFSPLFFLTQLKTVTLKPLGKQIIQNLFYTNSGCIRIFSE